MGQLLVVVCSLIISLRRPPPELIPDPLATGIGITVNGSGISCVGNGVGMSSQVKTCLP